MLKTICIFFLLAITHSTIAQNSIVWDLIINQSRGKKVSEIQQQLDDYFKGRDKGKGSGWKHYQRWLKFIKDRTDAEGNLVNHSAKNFDALLHSADLSPNETTRLGGNWYPLTMTSVTTGKSGRINCIAFHPTNANIIFAGTPGGGLWKSTDAGNTWDCISIGLAFLGVSGIAIDPGNPSTIYVLTGDGDGLNLPTIGVLKTTDGGLNWFETGLVLDATLNQRAYELKMAPGNSNLLIAVGSFGIYRTVNGGGIWTQELFTPTIFDVEFCPTNLNICYAASGTNIYVSANAGDTWTPVPVASYSPSKPGGSGRIELAVTPANPAYVYALFGGAAGYLGVYRSSNFGGSFTMRSNTPDILSYNAAGGGPNQFWWDLALTASPTNAEIIYTGGINIWKSSDGGALWGGIAVGYYSHPGSKYVHEDIHALEARSSTEVWVGCDGGVFKTTNGGTDWSFTASNLNALQFYDLDGTPANSLLFYGGTQDNGVIKFTPGTYEHVGCCDAGETIIDYTNSNNTFMNASNAYLYHSSTGFPASPPTTFSDITPWVGCGCQDTLPTFIVEAFKMNPVNHNSVFAVYRDCFKTYNNGVSWTRYVTGGNNVHNSIAIAPSDTNIVYITDGIVIRKSINGGVNWNPINLPVGVVGITQIAVDPADEDRIWISFGGFNIGSKVYEGLKSVASPYVYVWTNRSTGLPNVPVLCIATQNTPYFGVYVGTDIGVYLYTREEGWTPFMSGLPNVKVADLYLDVTNGYLTAATYGMGLWQTTSYGGCTPFVNHGPGFLATPIYGNEYFEASDSIRAGRFISGGSGTSVTYNSGGYVRMIPGFEVKAGTTVRAYIEGCTVGFRSEGRKPEEGELKK